MTIALLILAVYSCGIGAILLFGSSKQKSSNLEE
jgi:hypothetical protein